MRSWFFCFFCFVFLFCFCLNLFKLGLTRGNSRAGKTDGILWSWYCGAYELDQVSVHHLIGWSKKWSRMIGSSTNLISIMQWRNMVAGLNPRLEPVCCILGQGTLFSIDSHDPSVNGKLWRLFIWYPTGIIFVGGEYHIISNKINCWEDFINLQKALSKYQCFIN